jgi:hypothetical protein
MIDDTFDVSPDTFFRTLQGVGLKAGQVFSDLFHTSVVSAMIAFLASLLPGAIKKQIEIPGFRSELSDSKNGHFRAERFIAETVGL